MKWSHRVSREKDRSPKRSEKRSGPRADRGQKAEPERSRPREVSAERATAEWRANEVRRVLQEMEQGGRIQDLAKALHLRSAAEQRALEECVQQMLHDGELEYRGKRLQPTKRQTLIGTVSAHPDGFGFVRLGEGREDAYLSIEQMRGVMHGDEVEVRLVRFRGRQSAELVRVVQEVSPLYTGQFRVMGGVGMVEARSRQMNRAILVSKRDSMGAHDGDWVRVEVRRGSQPPRGMVIEVLGEVASPAALIDIVIADQGLPGEFPVEAIQEAEKLPDGVSPRRYPTHEDFTHLTLVTIDGEDARDFDDAICVEPRGDGFEAWVAIADVAEYVRPGSALDTEALGRGNSFYFPDRVLPMLPEKLSNGLCSLRPDELRLALVARMRFDANGRRRSIHLHEGVIRSRARLTYTQVAAFLEQGDEEAVAKPEVREMLLEAARLHRLLEKGRKRRGALDLDLPEVRARIERNRVAEMVVRERNVAHRLIEEMMLAANTAVAEYFESKETALLYRVHPAPKAASVEALNDFLNPFGMWIELHSARPLQPGDLQKVLERSSGREFAHVLHRLILRSMQQARYTPENGGHFGLAYPSYCHFTSPIRRYADLTVHRRLKALLRGEAPDTTLPTAKLAGIGDQVSNQERKQQRGEWETQAMLAALYHGQHVGESFAAVISGMTRRRLFFELHPSLAEGSLSIESLGRGFTFDEKGQRLYARRSGRSYKLGERVNVRILSTDPVRGQINVLLEEGE